MTKKKGEQIDQIAANIANKDIPYRDNLNTVLDSKGGFSEQTNLLKLTKPKLIISAEKMLKPYLETPLRHTQIVEKDNALKVMQKYADQFRGIEWIDIKEQKPDDYERVLYFEKSTGYINVGYFVWSQSPDDTVTHWMKLPHTPCA